LVTSPLANTGSSYHSMQPTKHEHTNSGYLYSPYQTRVVCIDLARFSLACLRILARLELPRLPNTPYLTSTTTPTGFVPPTQPPPLPLYSTAH
jgi:hypothetical protein